jgi:molybdenum cofactor cytidylyltransferase
VAEAELAYDGTLFHSGEAMIEPKSVALLLLAAGRSHRFGHDDKLAQESRGVPIGLHALRSLAAVPFGARFAVVTQDRLGFARLGCRIVRNERPEEGQSRSIRLGVEAARRNGAAAVLIVLADMPLVTANLVERILACASGPSAIVAASNGERSMPPALFGATWFEALLALEGDRGARHLLQQAQAVVTNAAELVDIDTLGDLQALRAAAV